MVQLVNPQFGSTVYDPFCGTGGFLTETFRHLSAQRKPTKSVNETLQQKSVYGGEITTTARIAKMNMILFGDGHSGVNQQDSLGVNSDSRFDHILSNIPFSQNVTESSMKTLGTTNGDEACVLRCLRSLKLGGSMAIVVPEGVIVNHKHAQLRWHLMRESRIRMIIHLPSGCFAPYTAARTAIIYLTDNGTAKTTWFYRVRVVNDGFSLDAARERIPGPSDLNEILYSLNWKEQYRGTLDVKIVHVENVENANSVTLREDWQVSSDQDYVRLIDVANIRNGQSITEKTAGVGDIPVIAGGAGTSPYKHSQSNCDGNAMTVSKSGAYAGYVWWHDSPIFASDSLIVQSKDESSFSSLYIYLCMRARQQEIYMRQQGTAQPHIYKDHIQDLPIPKLPLADQQIVINQYLDIESSVIETEKTLSDRRKELEEFISRTM